ncbi:MAG: hypothetical protein N2205_07870 [Candidatus Caldatribacterium sp.]|nr:hypothetical protein [Candidatus Caldatribacterium sp.]MDW8081643.1 hypothetical protein [Candidatus Calescibacterium sp.]
MARVLFVKVGDRPKVAVRVQEVLTQYGCNIRTRLGLHEFPSECEDRDEGLIILEVVGSAEEIEKLKGALETIESVKVVSVEL